MEQPVKSLIPISLLLSNYYLPESYDLKLSINHLKPNFNGEIIIDLVKNKAYNRGNLNRFEFTLHASNLVIIKAFLLENDNVTKLNVSYDRPNQRVIFTSDTVYSFPDVLKLSLSYMGQIKTIKTFKDKTHGLFKTNYLDSVSGKSDNYILATHTQPHSAQLIFPLIDELCFKVPIKLEIITCTKFKVISNSLLKESKMISMSENSAFIFESTPPISSSVFGFVIGDLEFLEDDSLDIPVRIYTAIGESSFARYALQLTCKFLPILEKLLDYKYPLDKFDIVSLPFLSDGAMENWGLVTIISSQLLLNENLNGIEGKMHLQELIAHELVHQWIGNLVTFDDWNCLWLNEAFATWLGNYVIKVSGITSEHDYELRQLENLENFLDKDCFYIDGKSSIESISSYMNSVNVDLDSSTSSIFDINAYEKGIILLSMLGNIIQNNSAKLTGGVEYTEILKGFKKVIEIYKFKTIKPFEIWNILNESSSFDIMSFVHSWLNIPGFPIVKVSSSGDRIEFEQHRYLYNMTAENLNLEDQPYHLPLSIKVIDEKGQTKLLNLILTDRTLQLEIPISQLVSINHNKSGFYRVNYSPELLDRISDNIGRNLLTRQDTIATIMDYGKRVGTTNSDANDLISIFKLLNSFTNKNWIVDYEVLKVALCYLESINHTILNFTPYEKFENWLSNYTSKLFSKLGGWDNLSQIQPTYSSTEMNVRNSILQLRLKDHECQQLAKKLFKSFVSSGISKAFTPKELLPSIFNLSIYNSSQKEYKKILEFVKNSDNSLLNNSNVSSQELQTIAVSSLSFVSNNELLNKTLNFVMTNIDSKLIELALIGFQYKTSKADRLKVFNWYKLHYDQWIMKSLRKGSDWAKQIGITVNNISKNILGEIMQKDAELLKIKDNFIEEKSASLPEHGLKQLTDNLQDEIDGKIAVGELYDILIANLP